MPGKLFDAAGGAIGSKEFVEEIFQANRESFGPKRKSGARKLRGIAAAANGVLTSLRDLQKDVAGAARVARVSGAVEVAGVTAALENEPVIF